RHRRVAVPARGCGPISRCPGYARCQALQGESDDMSLTRYEPARPRLQRSVLAVPGSQPALFRKALESEADSVFLDLEDAVAPGDKDQAREQVVAALLEHEWRERGKTISVRVNGIDTQYMYRDVVDVVEQ